MPTAAMVATVFSIIGTAFTASVSVPQLLRLWRTRDVAGVSASTVAFTAVAGASWGFYAVAHHLVWLAISSTLALVAQVPMLVVLAARGSWPRRSRVSAASLFSLYAAVALAFGWGALSVCLAIHVVIQYSPQVIVALRAEDLGGLSAFSAALLFVNGLTWGVVGLASSDVGLETWAVIVSAAGATIWTRVAMAQKLGAAA